MYIFNTYLPACLHIYIYIYIYIYISGADSEICKGTSEWAMMYVHFKLYNITTKCLLNFRKGLIFVTPRN